MFAVFGTGYNDGHLLKRGHVSKKTDDRAQSAPDKIRLVFSCFGPFVRSAASLLVEFKERGAARFMHLGPVMHSWCAGAITKVQALPGLRFEND
ncbi:MAG: hypothetical protein ACPGGJ_05635, partial [Coraliomargarita sp.]